MAFLLGALLVCCLAAAGYAAKSVFATLYLPETWGVWPAVAALLAFVVILELCAASVMTALHALLQLSYDTGRHRIGTLLTMIAIIAAGLVLVDLFARGAAPMSASVAPFVALTLAAAAFWFERAYRRPAYPGFRDFHGDVVDARRHLARAAHGG